MKCRFTVTEYKQYIKEFDMPDGCSDKEIESQANLLVHLHGWDDIIETKNKDSLTEL